MNFKDEIYKNYVTNHISSRKGNLKAFNLASYAIGFKQHFIKFLPKNYDAKILDLGCGSGSFVWWLNTLGFANVYGVDTSEEQVQMAKNLNIPNIYEGDVFDFLKKNSGHDLLIARDLIEHFDNQSVFDFLSLCNQSLNHDAKLLLQIPNGESPYFGRIRYGDCTHELVFTPASIKQLLLATGFHKISVHPWRPIITSFKSMVRYIFWRLIEYILLIPLRIETGRGGGIVTMNLIVVASKK